MTRSFGDTNCNVIGLISEPEIVYTKLTNEDKIIILGSDGF